MNKGDFEPNEQTELVIESESQLNKLMQPASDLPRYMPVNGIIRQNSEIEYENRIGYESRQKTLVLDPIIIENSNNPEKNSPEYGENPEISIKKLEIFGKMSPQESTIYPTTISKYWLPIDSLKLEAMYNKNYRELINSLKNRFAGWRRSRGDGNCYYRSVITSYLLKILHYEYQGPGFDSFINKIYELNGIEDEEYFKARNRIISFLEKIQKKNSEKIEKILNFKLLEENLQNPGFDCDLIRIARMISYFTLKKHLNGKLKAFIPESENDFRNILTMGMEAEGVELFLLPLGLEISVQQINIFDKVITVNYSDEECQNFETVFIINKIKGHYDILYHIQDMEDQQYCMKDGAYYYIES